MYSLNEGNLIMDNEPNKIISNLSFKEKLCKKISSYRKVILVLIIALGIYAFLAFIGIIHYPKWYIIVDFNLNKKHFEVVLNDKEIDYLTSTDTIDKCTTESQKSLKKLFKYGIYNRFGKNYECTYINGKYSVTDEIESCIFFTKSIRYDSRGVLYSDTNKSEIALNDGNVYRCYPIGDNWYYFEYAYKAKEQG